MTRLYDGRLNRALTQDDIPSDLTLAQIEQFCRANGVTFFCLDTLRKGDGSAPDWIRDPAKFRVGTNEYPSRGVDTSFDKVREWKTAMAQVDITDAQALCNELPLIEARLRKAGLYVTALKVREAVQQIGWELAEKKAGKASLADA